MATRYDEREYARRSATRPSTDRYSLGADRYSDYRNSAQERGMLDRAGDEVRSWFGDDEADRRRRMDNRQDRHDSSQHRYAERGRGTNSSSSDWDEVRAGDLMTRNVVTIYDDETLAQAARLMHECDCGALPVVDNVGRFVGMITDRDIAVRAIARGLDPRRGRVEECMTDETFACHVNDSLRECLHHMTRHQVRRMPVINDREQIIGIISQADLARHADENEGQGERRAFADAVAAVSEPTRKAYR
jgi:CBS domain-containing protein